MVTAPPPRSTLSSCSNPPRSSLPEDLEHILRNRAREVLALSLGEDNSFYCRYIAKNGTEYTVTGNLPSRLEFLLNAWWANQYEVPHIAFGPGGSYFFQVSAMTAWEHLPKRLEEQLLALRDTPASNMPRGAVTLGAAGSHVILSGEGETANFHSIDPELSDKLATLAATRRVETAVLSLVSTEDYILVFGDGSIFYSVPDVMVPVFQRFVKVYHQALIAYSESMPDAQKRYMGGVKMGEEGWEAEVGTVVAQRPASSPMSSPDSVPREIGSRGEYRYSRRSGKELRGRQGECRDEWCSCRRAQMYRGTRTAA